VTTVKQNLGRTVLVVVVEKQRRGTKCQFTCRRPVRQMVSLVNQSENSANHSSETGSKNRRILSSRDDLNVKSKFPDIRSAKIIFLD
jgi:hypothetical protein